MECQYCEILFVVEARLAERKMVPVYLQELECVGIFRGEKRGLEMVCRYPALSAISPCFSYFFELDFIIFFNHLGRGQ
jgi:hypothetical protein